MKSSLDISVDQDKLQTPYTTTPNKTVKERGHTIRPIQANRNITNSFTNEYHDLQFQRKTFAILQSQIIKQTNSYPKQKLQYEQCYQF